MTIFFGRPVGASPRIAGAHPAIPPQQAQQ
jgi:hypothetical protein